MAGVLGVDSSTQSTKVVLVDPDDGAVLAAGHAPHPATHPPRSEQDPQSWSDALDGALAAAGIGWADVDAVAVAGQQHGLVVLDAEGTVVRPAKLWNDTESAPDADWLLGRLDGGAAAWAQRCGSVPVAAFTITKLSWLHRSEPDAWARLRRVCLPHDWLTYRLSGAFVTDRGDASGTGYWSPEHDTWALDLLALIDDRDWEAALPRLAGPHEAVGTVRGHDTIVAPGTGDNMAAALGIGMQVGDVALSLGTSGTVYTRHTEATADASGAVAGFADATGEFLPLVCTLNATKVTDAIARLLGVDHERFDVLALAEPWAPGRDPVLLPYFDGERTPNRPVARGVLAGLAADVSREQLARAAVAGVVCGLLDGLDALTTVTGARPERVVLVGGGARSLAYRQVVADLAQLPVLVPAAAELVAHGAAVQAAAVLHAATPDAVGSAWGVAARRALVAEPRLAAANAAEVRAAYATLRN